MLYLFLDKERACILRTYCENSFLKLVTYWAVSPARQEGEKTHESTRWRKWRGKRDVCLPPVRLSFSIPPPPPPLTTFSCLPPYSLLHSSDQCIVKFTVSQKTSRRNFRGRRDVAGHEQVLYKDKLIQRQGCAQAKLIQSTVVLCSFSFYNCMCFRLLTSEKSFQH